MCATTCTFIFFTLAGFSALVLSSPARLSQGRPSYIECVSSSECSMDSCCVLGMGRYSIPTCQKKLQLYDTCRPASDESMNSTITYLDGSIVSLYDIHMIMCPCATGLTCDDKYGQCVDFDSHPSHNHVHENVLMED